MPAGASPSNALSRTIDSLWRADQGDTVERQFDIVLRMFAGYDETATWQEFGEMKFQTRDHIPREWGNPDTTRPRWVRTRYVDWTSWHAGQWLWSNSAIVQGEAISTIRHEISHFAFRIGDNYNNPHAQPYRRAPAGPWDLMDRGSFNGPGGPHRRWVSPPTEGGSMSAGLMLRQRLNFGFVDSSAVPMFSRDALAHSGIAVVNITARAAAPLPASLPGIVVRLDGAVRDRTPVDDPAANPLSSGTPDFDFYTVEVVQRIGYDSFTPDNGVLIAKNKTAASPTGGPNGFNTFTWVIDANPHDIGVIDFRRPNGEPVMRTIADYRQLNDALFHAGVNSGSEYEWQDVPNRLHFYVVDVQRDADGILSYTVAVRSLVGAGPQQRGARLASPSPASPTDRVLPFILTNSGGISPSLAEVQPAGTTQFFASDLYRLSVSVQGAGWEAGVQNALVTAPVGGSALVPVFVRQGRDAATTALVTLSAQSESDPGQRATASFTVRRQGG
jgi:M6 family metalloprotease-like protein